LQANHKATIERKNCISEISDAHGHAENLRSKSQRDVSKPLTPRRFV